MTNTRETIHQQFAAPAAPRDPLSLIRGDPALDAVWRDALQGQSSAEGRAALIRHYRAERERHLNKKAASDE